MMPGEDGATRFSLARSVLTKRWDPCCVGSNTHLLDEYDDYIPRVIELALTGDTAQVRDYLDHLENEVIGLKTTDETKFRVSDELVGLFRGGNSI